MTEKRQSNPICKWPGCRRVRAWDMVICWPCFSKVQEITLAAIKLMGNQSVEHANTCAQVTRHLAQSKKF